MKGIVIGLLLVLAYSHQPFAQSLIEVQSEVGIDHVYEQRVFNGGGVAFFDSDNDGDDDVYLTSGIGTDHFYINNGDGSFTYSSPSAGLNSTSLYYTTGVSIGDINGDGLNDIFVTTIFNQQGIFEKNLLFLNIGDNTFREIWNLTSPRDKAWSMGSVMLDHDLDGDLDIYVINYIEESNLVKNEEGEVIGFAHKCFPNRFYENLGDLEFRERSAQLGLDDEGCALAVTATDYDMDGDPDIYLANDFGEFVTPNKLFRNDINQDESFAEVSGEKNTDLAIYGMGIASGDIDNDLDLDLYVTNLGRNVLLQNDEISYTDITDLSGTANTWNIVDSAFAVSWGTHFLDIDHDEDLDLYVANGYAPTSELLPTLFSDADQLYINQGNNRFTLDSLNVPSSNTFVSRGTAYSDYDLDGDLDILTVVFDRPAEGGVPKTKFYRNDMSNGNWLQVHLRGTLVNTNAFGSLATIYYAGRAQIREVSGGSSHCSHNTQILHFGLGDEEHIDSLVISWTGGNHSQTLYNLSVNQKITVIQDTSDLVTSVPVIPLSSELNIFPNPVQSNVNIPLYKLKSKDIYKVEIYGTNGQFWKSRSIHQHEEIVSLPIEYLSSGTYVLKLYSPEAVLIAKFVKVD